MHEHKMNLNQYRKDVFGGYEHKQQTDWTAMQSHTVYAYTYGGVVPKDLLEINSKNVLVGGGTILYTLA